MPFQKRGSLLAKLAVTGAALAGLAALPSGAAAAGASCNIPATAQIFSQFGDPSYYYIADGGAFEGLTWTTAGGSALVSSTDSFALTQGRDLKSLRLPSGGTATSVTHCVSAAQPHLRFVAKANGTGALNVRVDLRDSAGFVIASTVESLVASDHAGWVPTRFISLNTGALAQGEKAYATITFESLGDWQVNDVYIDPYAK